MKRLVLILAWIAVVALGRAVPAQTGTADSVAAVVDSARATAPVPASASVLQSVNELEAIRREAMVKSDTKTLANFFAEDMTYVHSTGLMQSRSELFRLLERGDIRYVSFSVEKTAYRIYGSDTVVSTGVQVIELTSNGKPFTTNSRYTAVYARVAGDMKMVAYQSTPMPEMTPAKAK